MKRGTIHLYKIKAYDYPKPDLLYELIDEFIMPNQYKLYEKGIDIDEDIIDLTSASRGESKDCIKREIYKKLSGITGIYPDWGILTGVRPVKLCGELIEKYDSDAFVKRVLTDEYLISDDKANMIIDMYKYQVSLFSKAKPGSLGLYIGIPFCPTRCLYCSFASNQSEYDVIERYLDTLIQEIESIGIMLKKSDYGIESLYIGGGTPTSLDERQLNRLLTAIENNFNVDGLKEYTIEAGRPDTINKEKLSIIRAFGCDRISINPQSMKAKTLELIGRSHTPGEIETAFETACKLGFNSINADLIAGLPNENLDDFILSLDKILKLGADNITVHSLAIKRASRLREQDPEFHYKQSKVTNEMTEKGYNILIEQGFRPYYLYRQKHMAGAGENIGYCKDDKAGLYNIRIMDEHQSILALGAGAISKRYFSKENRLERIPNVTNVEHYIKRIDEMIKRKANLFFDQEGEYIC